MDISLYHSDVLLSSVFYTIVRITLKVRMSLVHYYRVYSLDFDDHHIVDVHDFRANTDAEALVKAGRSEGNVSRELWNRDRMVLDLPR